MGVPFAMGALAAAGPGCRVATSRPARLARVPRMSDPPDGREFGEVTGLLRAWSAGDADAFECVLPLVYEELHRTASHPSSRRHSSLTSAVACRLTVDRSPIR